jgi:hypothetical protein
MPELSKCPKCEGSMEAGYISDNTGGAIFHSAWISGAKVGFFKTPKAITIVAHRCVSCGFLESYAPKSTS